MRIGQLRHKIEFQQKTKTKNDIGSWSESWTKLLETRAAIWPVSASEQVKNQHKENEIIKRFRIRYRPGITPDMRILSKGELFGIESIVNVDERNRWLDILCSKAGQ